MSEAQRESNKIIDKSKQAFYVELCVLQNPDKDYEDIFQLINNSPATPIIPITSIVGRISELLKAQKIYISGEHKVGNRTRSLYRVMTPEKLVELTRGQMDIF